VLNARADQTVHTKLFDIGWPDAAHRVLRTELVERWERAGSPPTGQRPGEGEIVARMRIGEHAVELPRYAAYTPSANVQGDLGGLPFYAGQSVNLVNEIRPAAEIVRAIASEAEAVINSRLSSITR
jgi:NAD(P)H-dependent flavin oxidoreductase YrpB (nitropropane dioxygenase family)